MMKRIFTLLALTGALVLFVGGNFAMAAADMPVKGCDEKFESLDADSDGTISWGEYKAAYDPGTRATMPSASGSEAFFVFNKKDADQDGVLTKKELCTMIW